MTPLTTENLLLYHDVVLLFLQDDKNVIIGAMARQRYTVYVSEVKFPLHKIKQMHHVTKTKQLRNWNIYSVRFSFLDGSVFPLSSLLDLYCTLEVDSYGYFVSKAKTRVFRDTTEPHWNEVSHQDMFYYCSILTLYNCIHSGLLFSICVNWKGVWDWVGGLPVPADPVLREVLWQEHAQQGRQWDCGQDHGKRASPGMKTASDRLSYREMSVFSWGHFPAYDSF